MKRTTRRRPTRLIVAALGAAVLAGAVAYSALVRKSPGPRTPGAALAAGANVVVITVDTLRADHLAPYGYQNLQTPTIDRLARDGVRFASAYAAVPLTLPSHCTIFTGLLPPTHGVRDNGSGSLAANRATLATLLKSADYSTAAFVSAFVLDSRWGLANGFDEYYDDFPVSLGDLGAMARVQRPAGATWSAARRWLDTHAAERFFLWLHLFDPHTPYEPPEPYRTELRDHPYDGEIAYVDSVLSEVVADLASKSLLEKTVVVLLSDHGEGLGDHDEDEHGLLAYDSTLRVPWIVRLPNRQLAGTVIEQPVGLVDVLPTILDLVGVPPPDRIDGTSRAATIRDPRSGSADVVYAETLYPRLRFGWSELLAVRNERFKLIRGPRAELYDYRSDPGERNNLADRDRDETARLDRILTRVAEAHPSQAAQTAATDPDTANRLRALGYVAGSPTVASGDASTLDPRDKTRVYRELVRARRLLDEGHEREGLQALERVIAEEPNLQTAHRTLREYRVGHRQLEAARRWVDASLAKRPGDVRLLVDLAVIERAAGQPDRAVAALSQALARSPDDVEALTLSGEVLREVGRHDDALDRFTRAARLASADSSIRMQAAQTLFASGRIADAESAVTEILGRDPHTSGAHYLLAQVAELRKDGSRAEHEYRHEIVESPWDHRARFNLALLLGQRGAHRESVELLSSIPQLAPEFAEVHFYLAKALLDLGDSSRFPEAIASAQRGLEKAPSSPSAPLGHYVLADIYRLQGRHADAEREMARGRALERRLGEAAESRRHSP